MKLDKQILEEKIRKHRETKSCSESTLMGLCETAEADITTEQMTKLWQTEFLMMNLQLSKPTQKRFSTHSKRNMEPCAATR